MAHRTDDRPDNRGWVGRTNGRAAGWSDGRTIGRPYGLTVEWTVGITTCRTYTHLERQVTVAGPPRFSKIFENT